MKIVAYQFAVSGNIKSFSPTNLKYMRYFYEMYPTDLNRPQLGDDSENELNRSQAGDDLENAIFFIPCGNFPQSPCIRFSI